MNSEYKQVRKHKGKKYNNVRDMLCEIFFEKFSLAFFVFSSICCVGFGFSVWVSFFFFLLVFDLVSCFFSAGWLMVFNFLLTLCGVFRFGQFCDFGCIWFDCW